MKTVFQQVQELIDQANTCLGEVDWHWNATHNRFSQATKAVMITKLEKTQALVDSLKEKASK